jgi:hypothetical protein
MGGLRERVLAAHELKKSHRKMARPLGGSSAFDDYLLAADCFARAEA